MVTTTAVVPLKWKNRKHFVQYGRGRSRYQNNKRNKEIKIQQHFKVQRSTFVLCRGKKIVKNSSEFLKSEHVFPCNRTYATTFCRLLSVNIQIAKCYLNAWFSFSISNIQVVLSSKNLPELSNQSNATLSTRRTPQPISLFNFLRFTRAFTSAETWSGSGSGAARKRRIRVWFCNLTRGVKIQRSAAVRIWASASLLGEWNPEICRPAFPFPQSFSRQLFVKVSSAAAAERSKRKQGIGPEGFQLHFEHLSAHVDVETIFPHV